jgi:energy-coupling factor transporter transmembrane protein EcfT
MQFVNDILGACPLKMDHNFEFGVNILIHVVILFAILAFFFMFYVSHVASNAFKNEFEELIGKNLGNLLNQYDDGTLKSGLKTLNETKILDVFENIYSKPDEVVAAHNALMQKITFMILIFCVITIIVIIGVIYYTCGKCVSLKDILIDNLIVFTFIGVAEYLFFTKIAVKFIPSPPSLLVNTIIESLKKSLTE